jgi:hypothetical protein
LRKLSDDTVPVAMKEGTSAADLFTQIKQMLDSVSCSSKAIEALNNFKALQNQADAAGERVFRS